jgi:hypothetical protein
LLKLKKHKGFRWEMQQPAAKYWLSKDKASAKRMNSLITRAKLKPVLETDAEIHVGVNLSRSVPGEPKSLSLDLNNNNFDPETDTFTPTKLFSVSIELPSDFKPPFEVSVSELGKDDRPMKFTRKDGRLSITFEPFEIYQIIQIEEMK